ncbi:glyoxalase [Georgenia sp. TF02-10]|uniref:glyoxalase n=1 Tax=Georgenia sp. TF02-10 TaxID=2917725 RepID=UPI001FA7E1A1|nr:glyoxalase [Georgenia sp. TF02-10]UNX53769.1 glyoxalase [Georgenia sp. TF02-10]
MEIAFVAGFGPISAEPTVTLDFWARRIGVPFEEIAPGYHHASGLDGVKAFALWPLSQAAQATFGTDRWPEDRPIPQAWIELEVSSPEAVAGAVEELRAKGQEILTEAHQEPWGQTTARLLSPEGMLVGISYLPSFHGEGAEGDEG